MPGEVRIQVDVNAAKDYQFRVRSDRREFATSIRPELAASFYEDLRLLRWKSIGLHDPGDILLNHVGDRLASLVAPSATWEELRLPQGALRVRIQFAGLAHRLMPFPWEILRVCGRFLAGTQGSHVIREVSARGGTRRRRPTRNVLHMSLGTDSALRLDEERCQILETLPANTPIEFLIDPSPGHLETWMDVFRPHVVVVSGHGHYDDLEEKHYLVAGEEKLPTAWLVALCASYGCQLLVLSTCESARLAGPVINGGIVLPADLIAFSFPVRNTTATQSLARLLQELIRGVTIDDAMAAVRAIDTEDEYAFFNAVHIHRSRARSLQFNNAVPPTPISPTVRCPGMELALGTLNSVAHWQGPVTLLAPAGSGGDALIQHWAALVQRSQTQANRWRVLLEGAPILNVNGGQTVRLAFPYSFVPLSHEHLVYCDGMDRALAKTLLLARDPDLARSFAAHPLLGMPSFVDDLIAGCTENQAVERFERENCMPERAGKLTREGTLFASWLFATESVASTTFENRVAFAETMKKFGMNSTDVVAGIENALEATVMFARPDGLFLAPEFMLLGERWFPNWRDDHRRGFQLLYAAFATLAASDQMDAERDSRLLDWAIRLQDWTAASLICIAMCRWFGKHGRLEDMKVAIERLLPYVIGMERIILRGHLVTIATDCGDYRAGLAENQQIERDLQDVSTHDDYHRNLHASITQQIDCLRELGRLDEAEQRWRDAYQILPLASQRAEAEARLLGQLAHLRREQDRIEEALDVAAQAVQFAVSNECAAVLIAELRHTRADLLRQVGRDQDAIRELNAVADYPMSPALRSRFLHLKALLLKGNRAPQALEYLLESYQEDRLRGDSAGVAISLLAIAQIFTDEEDYDRARERIREALPLADKCGLVTVVASLALLWAEIDLAEGKNTSATIWLAAAKRKFSESQDESGVAHVTRLLNALQGRAQ